MAMTHPGLAREQFGRVLPDRAAGTAPARAGRLPWPVIVYMIAVLVPIGFNLGPLYMTGLRSFLLVMMVPLIVKLLRGDMGRILLTDILFFTHITWTMVAISVNNPDMVVQNIGSAAVEFLGGYLVGRAYIRSRAEFVALCRFLGTAVCLTLPLALLESQTGNPIVITLIDKLPGIRSVGNVNIEPRMGLQRAQVMLSHPIHYGLFCSTAFALTLLGLKDAVTPAVRLAMGAAVGLCVFLSLSSGALLPMILQIFLIGWAAVFARTGRAWLLLFILIAVSYVTIDLLSNRTPIRVFFSYATFSSHNAYWRGQIFDWGMINVWANPIYGIGLNDWVRPFYMYSGSMDNFWLVMAVRYGIPGFVLVAGGYGYALWRITRRDFSGDEALIRLRRAWVFTFVGLTVTMCTVHVWTTVYSYVFFLFGTGMWLLSAEPERAPKAAPGTARSTPPARHGRESHPAPELPDRASVSRPGSSSGSIVRAAEVQTAEGPTSSGSRHTRFPIRHRRREPDPLS